MNTQSNLKFNIGKNILLVFLMFLGAKINLRAQKPLNPIQDNKPKSVIELVRADSLVGDNSISRTQTFLGNVIFIHRGVKLGCDKAIHNQSSNQIEAFGKIVINQGDTLTIVGDTLYYDGNTRFARVTGKSVILRDKKVTLRTTKINYDLNRDQAYYPVFGTINQDSSKLSSKTGYYNTKTKFFRYIGDVEILNPSYTLCTDSLDYDTYTKLAYFKTFTTIKSKDGDLSAYKGNYNIQTKISNFEGRAKVANLEYSLEADTLVFDRTNDAGLAIGKVIFLSFKDSLRVIGNKGNREGKIGLTKIMGDTVTERISNNDTVYIAADTLFIFQTMPKKVEVDTLKKEENEIVKRKLQMRNLDRLPTLEKPTEPTNEPSQDDPDEEAKDKKEVERIIADGNVKVFRKDFQSKSDSLIYNLKDSTIHFFSNPLIWSKDSQLEADTIIVRLKNNKINHLKLIQNGFVVSIDTVNNFNQIKGREIDAFFDKNTELKTIKVEGNGESLYFALDEKNKIVGLNKVECSSMQFVFGNKKIKVITFRGDPESTLIPPKEIIETDVKLENFEYKIKLKPSKAEIVEPKFLKMMEIKPLF